MQGYTELLELLREHRERHGFNLPVDVYGTGEDLEAIKARAQAYELEVQFQGDRDHLDDSIHPYRSALLLSALIPTAPGGREACHFSCGPVVIVMLDDKALGSMAQQYIALECRPKQFSHHESMKGHL